MLGGGNSPPECAGLPDRLSGTPRSAERKGRATIIALARLLFNLQEVMMGMRRTIFAAALLTGASTGAMAQYCPPGYALYGGVCQPIRPSYSNPVSGAVSGEAAGASQGYATGGPVGA